MKIIFNSIVFLFIFSVFPEYCCSQTNNDSLNLIFSSDKLTLEEDYAGDWGGYWYKFVFTVKGEEVRIQWKNPELLKNGKDLDMLLPVNELEKLEMIFRNCSQRIATTTKGSTEHIVYKFSTDKLSYTIDDRFTMACYEEFKLWKEAILAEWKKAGNK